MVFYKSGNDGVFIPSKCTQGQLGIFGTGSLGKLCYLKSQIFIVVVGGRFVLVGFFSIFFKIKKSIRSLSRAKWAVRDAFDSSQVQHLHSNANMPKIQQETWQDTVNTSTNANLVSKEMMCFCYPGKKNPKLDWFQF